MAAMGSMTGGHGFRRLAAVVLAVGLVAAWVPAAAAAVPAATVHRAAGWPHVVSSATPAPSSAGYWDVLQDGTVVPRNGAPSLGDASQLHLAAPIVGIAATPSGQGYWLVGSDGGIFTYGDARFYGSTGNLHLKAPIVGIAPTADGAGYWLVASDGGIFAFGDATFYGSMGGHILDRPVVGMAATAGGGGYWLVASDGGIFAFGDATFDGSMGGRTLDAPIVGMAPGPSGGYWLVGSDGGIFSFDVPYEGSAVGRAQVPTSGLIDSNAGGYLVILSNGTVLPYPGLTVSTSEIPSATEGSPYQLTLATSGGERPYTWTVAPGSALPPGLGLSAAGVISGTPTMAGQYDFSLQLVDGLGEILSYSGAIDVLSS